MEYKFVIISFLIITVACNNAGKKEKVAPSSTGNVTKSITDKPEDVAATNYRNGKAVYLQYCAACHMDDGLGVRDIQPPLTDPKWISDNEQFIAILEKGISGEMDVNGQAYNNIMPANKHLSNTEMANLITFVRNSFGNKLAPITKDEVATIRRKL